MKHFQPHEFRCRCGCGLGVKSMSPRLLEMLDEAREYAQVPMVITSAIRCEAHNRAVGGKPNSSHLKGLAVDIAVHGNSSRFAIRNALIATGFKRIGTGKNFLHVDIDETKMPAVEWVY